jgi:hypothetical protein
MGRAGRSRTWSWSRSLLLYRGKERADSEGGIDVLLVSLKPSSRELRGWAGGSLGSAIASALIKDDGDRLRPPRA